MKFCELKMLVDLKFKDDVEIVDCPGEEGMKAIKKGEKYYIPDVIWFELNDDAAEEVDDEELLDKWQVNHDLEELPEDRAELLETEE
jgi:hypothetical protein